MLKVAITGGIASGKSYALEYFSSLGYPTISADDEIQKIYKNQKVLNQISKIFNIKNATKETIKPIVLKDKFKLRILEKLLYKKLHQNFNKFEASCRLKKYKFCFFEIPLLFEKKMNNKYDYIINIEVPIFIQKNRFLKRGFNTANQFYNFTKFQLHKDQKRYLNKKCKGVNFLNFKNSLYFKHAILKSL